MDTWLEREPTLSPSSLVDRSKPTRVFAYPKPACLRAGSCRITFSLPTRISLQSVSTVNPPAIDFHEEPSGKLEQADLIRSDTCVHVFVEDVTLILAVYKASSAILYLSVAD